MRSVILTTLVAVGATGLSGTAWPGLRAADKPAKPPGLPAEVFKHWIHSHEEDAEGVKVFRPAGYKFPPARGRAGFEIKQNGDFIDHPIGPTDRNEKVPGTWKLDEDGKVVVTFRDPARTPLVLEIVSCDGKVLKIK